MEEIGYVESDNLPPVIPIHEGKPKRQIRVYANEEILLILSEVGLNHQQVRDFTQTVINFLRPLQPEAVLVLGGIENGERGKIYAITNFDIKLNGIDSIDHGATTGTMALLLLSDLPVIALLAPVEGNVDIKASTELLKTVGKIIGKKMKIPSSAMSLMRQKKKTIEMDNSIYG